MFTVKATYRAETRRFTFPDDSFPSYDKLVTQIYKVFPLANAYFMSRLIFSPNPLAPGQSILIGLEAHDEAEYDKHIAQYQGRSWPGALLKFTVYDETPHKRPSASVASQSRPLSMLTDITVASDTVVESDIPETPASAPVYSMPVHIDDPSIDIGRTSMLAPIRERVRTQAQMNLSSTPERPKSPESTVSSLNRPASSFAETVTPRVSAGRIPDVSVSTRLSAVLRDMYAQRSVSASNAASSSSGRIPRFQDELAAVHDRSIELMGETAALMEQSSALKRIPFNAMHTFPSPSAIPAAAAAGSESRATLTPAYAPIDEAASEHASLHERSEEETIENWRCDIPPPSMGSQASQSVGSRPRSFIDSPEPSPAPFLPSARPSSGTVGPAQDHSFEEATERTYRLGLDLLRRSSSYAAPYEAVSEDSETSSDEETVPPVSTAHVCTARDETERGRLLDRLRVSRPLPPRPIAIPSPPGAQPAHAAPTFRSRSPSLESVRSRGPAIIRYCRRSPSVDSISRCGYRHSSSPDSSVGPPVVVPPPPQLLSIYRSRSRSSTPPRRINIYRSMSRSRSRTPPLHPYSSSSISYFSPPPPPPPPIFPSAYQQSQFIPHAAYVAPPSEPYSAAQHACGWADECKKLKRQVDDVQSSLAELRLEFQEAVSKKQIVPDEQAPAAPPAAHAAECPGGGRVASSDDSSPIATMTDTLPPGFVPIRVHGSFSPPGSNPTPSSVNHPRIICDGCEGPVVGVRHKCLDCENFDFCSVCLNNPHMRIMHDSRHAFFPVDVPDEITLFRDVQYGRRGVEHLGITCNACNARVFGTRHKCVECADFDLCEKCVSSPAVRSRHEARHHFFPIEYPWDQDAYLAVVNELTAQVVDQGAVHPATCDGCDQTIHGVRHKCLSCEDFDFCPSCIASPEKRAAHDVGHAFFPIDKPNDKHAYFAARAKVEALPPPRPAVHENVFCDKCNNVVIGIRHKCLDCLNFDLCDRCVELGAKRDHHGAHQFLSISKPGEVIVHTVHYDEPLRQPTPPRVPTPPLPPVAPLVVHSAVCNLCDSTIRGSRYKCLNCPNFDTCRACFSITPEHHPGHGFVRVNSPDDLMLRNILRADVVHAAKCNECGEHIYGTRYKCLHAECPDYDLCQNCEALPISVHPQTHPLVRLRIPETEIPCVYARLNWQPSGSTHRPERRAPSPPYAPIPAEAIMCARTPTPSFTPVIPDLPPAPSAAPLIPATWTPQDIDWRWTPTPPCPMSIPRVLQSEEQTPLLAPSMSEPLARIPSPLMHPLYGPSMSCFAPTCPIREVTTPVSNEIDGPVVEDVHAPSITASSPRVASPAPLPRSPPRALIDLEEPSTTSTSRVQSPPVPSSLEGLSTPSDRAASPMALTEPVPRLEPVQNQEWRELWPELTTMFRHLLQPATPPAVDEAQPEVVNMPGAMTADDILTAPIVEKETQTTVEEPKTIVEEPKPIPDESPLAEEALLAPPAPTAEMVERSRTNLLEALNRIAPALVSPPPAEIHHHATFVGDNNIADGTIFPPGAEFVKSWIMRNDGDTAWPEETTLRYVAGDRMLSRDGVTARAPVGCVLPGAEAELVGCEMKAPDVPGKYVSYWRLHDGNEFFGSSIWVEIVVAELDHGEDPSSEESLAASSVIVPPAPSAGAQTHQSTGMSVAPSTTVPSSPLSDDGSFDSSLSLIDAPSSPSIASADDEIFQDSREAASPVDPTTHDMEYVVLYDTTSSEDSE